MANTLSFPVLTDYLLPPPAAALTALLLTLGACELGVLLSRWIDPGNSKRLDKGDGRLESVAAFFAAAGVLAAVVHGLALAQFASLWLLRTLAAVVVLCGLWGLIQAPRRLKRLFAWFDAAWGEASLVGKGLWIGAGTTFVGLALAALGPPTDIDSLDYHLGVPLAWLRAGGFDAQPFWLHARLAGLGESLNLLGLAAGTDTFGAGLQLAGMAIAARAVVSLARDGDGKAIGLALVVCCPAMLALTTTQKPQMLPAAATTVAILLLGDVAAIDRRKIFLAIACVGFAAGCKFSFLLSGAVIAAMAIQAAMQNRSLWSALLGGIAFSTVTAGQVFVRNYFFYGDPLSPCLEKWLGGDPVVVRFAEYLRDFGGGRSPVEIATLPMRLAVTRHPGDFSEVLGVGVFAFLVGLFGLGGNRRLLFAAGALSFCILALGQLSPRFFLEPYLWSAAAVVGARPSVPRRILGAAMLPQSLLTALAACLGAAMLFPGAWSAPGRDAVQQKTASTYAAMVWLNEILPPDAVIATDMRSNAILPRRAVPSDSTRFLLATPLPEAERRRRMHEATLGENVDFVIVQLGKSHNFHLIDEHLERWRLSPQFADATRNPFNRAGLVELQIFRVKRRQADPQQ